MKNPSLRPGVQLQICLHVLSLPPQMTGSAQTKVSLISNGSAPRCVCGASPLQPPSHRLSLGLMSALKPSATHLSSWLNEKAKLSLNEPFVFIHAVTTFLE